MRKLVFVAAAILAASLAGPAIAADKASEIKAARADYDKARAKAQSDYTAASAECKKAAAEKQSDCQKLARQARRKARVDAGEDYTKVTGKPDPSPGH